MAFTPIHPPIHQTIFAPFMSALNILLQFLILPFHKELSSKKVYLGSYEKHKEIIINLLYYQLLEGFILLLFNN